MRDKTFYVICITVILITLILMLVYRKKLKLKIVPNPIRWTDCLLRAICAVLLLFSFACCFAAQWYIYTYGDIGFDSIYYTMSAELGGVDPDLISSCINSVLNNKGALFWLGIVFGILFFWNVKLVSEYVEGKQIRIYPFAPTVTLVFSLALSGGFLWNAMENTAFLDFIRNGISNSTLYEEEYVSPKTVEITFPEQKRNLIYLYLESMENTFLSEELGGALPYNTIPELGELAQENTCFSENDGVGGFLTPYGTTWTIAGIVGHTAGIPLKVPTGVGTNGYGADGNFLPGVTTITDILHENGYVQALVLGSEVSFGGQKEYLDSHGMDEFYDFLTAPKDGVIPAGYTNGNWGLDDFYLYDYAKMVISNLASSEKPFAVSMMTIDTHFPNGYRCDLCEDTYEEQYENVFRCSSAQVAAFIQWCKEQPWYENTTIVIVGDHLTMDGAYIGRNVEEGFDRRVYNCIINAAVEPVKEKYREFSTLDMFPTTLVAMGCTIEGNKLGLGTNLFSEVPTLVEEMGRERFEGEVARFSEYYAENFW